MAEQLCDWDGAFQTWLMAHFLLVRRTIGVDRAVRALDGFPTQALPARMTKPLFPELWDVRVEMTKRWAREGGFAPGQPRSATAESGEHAVGLPAKSPERDAQVRPDDLARVRAEFPLLAGCVYLNNNSTGAIPRAVAGVLVAYWETLAHWRDEVWEGWWRELHAYADAIAVFIGAPSGTVWNDVNLSSLLGRLLGAIDFAQRPEIITTELEFPTVPFLLRAQEKRGAIVRVVPVQAGQHVDEEELLAAIGERTRLVCLSHASYETGALLDVAAVVRRAHDLGAWVAVDAYQSVGVVPVDVGALDVDFLLGGAHKWLCGSTESAFLYVHPRLLSRLEPTATGWMATRDPLSFGPAREYSDTARRFASGTPAVLPALVSQVGLRLLARDRRGVHPRGIAAHDIADPGSRARRGHPDGHAPGRASKRRDRVPALPGRRARGVGPQGPRLRVQPSRRRPDRAPRLQHGRRGGRLHGRPHWRDAMKPRALLSLLFHAEKALDLVQTALNLGVLERLDAGPVSLDALCAATGAVPGRMYKFLDGLESLGLVERRQPRDALGSSTYLSREPLTGPARAVLGAESIERDRNAYPWLEVHGRLPEVLRGGRAAPFEWPPGTPEAVASFEASMAAGCAPLAEAFRMHALTLFGLRRQTGGSTSVGATARSQPGSCPGRRTSPRTCSTSPPSHRSSRAAPPPPASSTVSASSAETSCASRSPGGYDVISFVRVLHDWPAETARTLVTKAHAALAAGGTVVVCEEFRTSERLAAQFFWTYFLIGADACVSRLREVEWYLRTLDDVGFQETRVLPGPCEVIVARKQRSKDD